MWEVQEAWYRLIVSIYPYRAHTAKELVGDGGGPRGPWDGPVILLPLYGNRNFFRVTVQ